MFSLWKSPKVFIPFIFSVIIFGGSASYLLEMAVLISLEGNLAQTRMGVGWVALLSKGHMRGQYNCFMKKISSFYVFFLY